MRLVLAVFLGSIVGCGGGGSSEADTTNDEGGSATTASTTEPTTMADATMSTSTTTESSSGSTTDAPTNTSITDESSTTTGADGASSSSGSGDESSSDSGSESGTTMHQACTDGCAIEFMCGDEWASAEECTAWCEANLVKAEAFSPFCAGAWENLSACFGTLDCMQFAEYENPQMYPFPCSDQADALAFECKGQ